MNLFFHFTSSDYDYKVGHQGSRFSDHEMFDSRKNIYEENKRQHMRRSRTPYHEKDETKSKRQSSTTRRHYITSPVRTHGPRQNREHIKLTAANENNGHDQKNPPKQKSEESNNFRKKKGHHLFNLLNRSQSSYKNKLKLNSIITSPPQKPTELMSLQSESTLLQNEVILHY